MKSRDAVIRRVLIRLRDHFAKAGWSPTTGPATMLVMSASPSAGIQHKLMVDEPLSTDQLPSQDVLGLSCSVSVTFDELEAVVCAVFGYDPRTYGSLSASLALCQIAAKNCHLGVHLVSPDTETSLRRLIDDYHAHLEPVLKQLNAASVFEDEKYVPPAVGTWSWNMRRAAYYYLHKPKHVALAYFDALERKADEALVSLGVGSSSEGPPVFGTVAGAVEAGKRRAAMEAKKMAATLRDWTIENRPRTNITG